MYVRMYTYGKHNKMEKSETILNHPNSTTDSRVFVA